PALAAERPPVREAAHDLGDRVAEVRGRWWRRRPVDAPQRLLKRGGVDGSDRQRRRLGRHRQGERRSSPPRELATPHGAGGGGGGIGGGGGTAAVGARASIAPRRSVASRRRRTSKNSRAMMKDE